MNKIKKIILYVALLVALCLCSTIAMKILDLILPLNYESIWAVGFRVGFIVWIAMIVIEGYHWIKDKKMKSCFVVMLCRI